MRVAFGERVEGDAERRYALIEIEQRIDGENEHASDGFGHR